jgi:uncharacterized SAM-binding protein YcdF (DUF218 family)
MIRRLAAFLLLVWLFGFVWFAVALPQPRDGGRSDGVIVLTGGGGRIDRGVHTLRQGWAKRMLVAGVDPDVRSGEFQVEYDVPAPLMRCCIELGYESVDTRSNAREAARWIARNKLRTVRLVTTDWHMRRAAFELGQMTPDEVRIVSDAVPSRPAFRTLLLEYNKLLARRLARLWGG